MSLMEDLPGDPATSELDVHELGSSSSGRTRTAEEMLKNSNEHTTSSPSKKKRLMTTTTTEQDGIEGQEVQDAQEAPEEPHHAQEEQQIQEEVQNEGTVNGEGVVHEEGAHDGAEVESSDPHVISEQHQEGQEQQEQTDQAQSSEPIDSLVLSAEEEAAAAATKKRNMPRQKRRKWKDEDMEIALGAIAAGEMTERAASTYFGVPRATLNDYRHQRPGAGNRPGPKTLLDPGQEQYLVNWIIERATDQPITDEKHDEVLAEDGSKATASDTYQNGVAATTDSTTSTSKENESISDSTASATNDNPLADSTRSEAEAALAISESSQSNELLSDGQTPMREITLSNTLVEATPRPIVKQLTQHEVAKKVQEMTVSLRPDKPEGIKVTSGWWRRFIGRHPELRSYIVLSRSLRNSTNVNDESLSQDASSSQPVIEEPMDTQEAQEAQEAQEVQEAHEVQEAQEVHEAHEAQVLEEGVEEVVTETGLLQPPESMM